MQKSVDAPQVGSRLPWYSLCTFWIFGAIILVNAPAALASIFTRIVKPFMAPITAAKVEMHAIQTSGNTIRNTTADPFAGVAAEPAAEFARDCIAGHDGGGDEGDREGVHREG